MKLPLLALLSLFSLHPVVRAGDNPGTSYLFSVSLNGGQASIRLLKEFDILRPCEEPPLFRLRAHSVRVLVQPSELKSFLSLGLAHRLIERGKPYRDVIKNKPLAPDARYYTPKEMEAELLALEKKYPGLAKRVDLNLLTKTGATHEGRHLFALKISDKVAQDEGEPTALLAAQHHARELNAPYMVLQAAKRVLAGYASDPLLKKTVNSYELWFVPCVNPDGVNYVWTRDRWWRKNRRRNSGGSYGVDLNRNYPFHWGKCGSTSSRETSSTYRGPRAASEPETQTMMALAKLKAFDKYLDFHSYGHEVLTTYGPCQQRAYAGKRVLQVEAFYRNLIRAKMRFATRSPSASGEAPEWHWATNGSLSYLVEVGTSFQPSFTTTVSEERRVWPGIRAFLGLRPSLSGSVLSLKGRTLLASTIDPSSALQTNQGEQSTSGQRAGPYHLWLPTGTWTLPFQAKGHQSLQAKIQAPALGSSQSKDLTLIPILPTAILNLPNPYVMGTKAQLVFKAGDPGRGYWIPMSLGTTPGIQVGPRHLPINPDGLLLVSANPHLAPNYIGHMGNLDTKGEARASLTLPRTPALLGFKLFFIGMTFENGYPFGLKTWSTPKGMVLR
jgi:hypothetical protein